ncbi:2-hydroxychromene-2-carboxylate isomerase [Jannaschia sp. W003]|uniref:2-hydroxychromene-2-carboxylate isomerase n=1 Tax=Jannaschia sp. W003 TaxID=2867012 RepID=UPI0021A56F00|nr:2-hydroxychromene-2-carboxylate isomerase [Jannaschia sp. W003]UWQ20005.1 2-hydroxychromene-2-carboxylate isomerase [Jannaschia sp. W003]
MTAIDYFFTPLSPFTYLAGTRLEEIAAETGAEIRYRPLDVVQLFGRTGGTPPKDRHPARQAYRLQEMRRLGAKLGLPINLKPAHWPTNPAPAAFAIIGAQRAGGGGDLGALAHGLARACWAEERDIADDGVIREVLERSGFDGALADVGMLEAAEEYGRNLEDAVAANVFGAPFYVVGEEVFWGQDRLEDLRLHLKGEI